MIYLCELDELDPANGAKGLEFSHNGKALSLFIVRQDNSVYAYKNACPHTSVELNWLPNQFLDLDGAYIQCATHDARFQIADGLCIAGPCVGQSLQSIPIHVNENRILITEPLPDESE